MKKYSNLPILFFKSMHCDMWGNCNIFFHFLLFPLLLSAPPEINQNSSLNFLAIHKQTRDPKRTGKCPNMFIVCERNSRVRFGLWIIKLYYMGSIILPKIFVGSLNFYNYVILIIKIRVDINWTREIFAYL